MRGEERSVVAIDTHSRSFAIVLFSRSRQQVREHSFAQRTKAPFRSCTFARKRILDLRTRYQWRLLVPADAWLQLSVMQCNIWRGRWKKKEKKVAYALYNDGPNPIYRCGQPSKGDWTILLLDSSSHLAALSSLHPPMAEMGKLWE